MEHFIANLHSYLMFEVVETAWRNLASRARAAAGLDDIIAAHDAFLSSVLRKSLVDLTPTRAAAAAAAAAAGASSAEQERQRATTETGRERETVLSQLHRIFDVILRFCSLQSRLHAAALEVGLDWFGLDWIGLNCIELI